MWLLLHERFQRQWSWWSKWGILHSWFWENSMCCDWLLLLNKQDCLCHWVRTSTSMLGTVKVKCMHQRYIRLFVLHNHRPSPIMYNEGTYNIEVYVTLTGTSRERVTDICSACTYVVSDHFNYSVPVMRKYLHIVPLLCPDSNHSRFPA